jgi:hypothetical protein
MSSRNTAYKITAFNGKSPMVTMSRIATKWSTSYLTLQKTSNAHHLSNSTVHLDPAYLKAELPEGVVSRVQFDVTLAMHGDSLGSRWNDGALRT